MPVLAYLPLLIHPSTVVLTGHVLHFYTGHSDVVMGVVCTNSEDLYTRLRFVQNGIGAVPSPFDCFLAHRGLKTLHLRMEASARNAYAIALFLESHVGVNRVVYPGLESHPQHAVAKTQQHGFGSMITFYCKGGRPQSAVLLQSVSVSLSLVATSAQVCLNLIAYFAFLSL